jgi:hypothetical protein
MSGSDYIVFCPACNAQNIVRGKSMTLALTCRSCEIYFRTGAWDKTTAEFLYKSEQPALPIGAKGRIDNFLYEVMGFVVKQENKYKYRWREYLLFNPFIGYAFLSEYNGYWNFVAPMESDPRPKTGTGNFDYNGNHFELYQKYTAEVVYATGEFFFDVVDITATTVNHEYIAPPHLLALEQSEDSLMWFEGEYIAAKEIAKKFSVPAGKLPGKTGVGYTQPVTTAFSGKALIIVGVLAFLLTLFIHTTINSSSEDAIVFQGTFKQADIKDQKLLVSPSFNLPDGSQNLEVYISAPLSNDWFFSDFALIDEGTGTEYNFSQEIEYYSGYEGGESWSEGSSTGEALLSKIPGGYYHINFYPVFSPTNQFFSVEVRRDVPISSNFYITCLGLALFPLVFFVRKHHHEQQRWSESDFSSFD